MPNKKRRIGQNMKPRNPQAVSGVPAKQEQNHLSANEGQQAAPPEPISEPQDPAAGGSTLEPNPVQNLESAEAVSVAHSNLEDLMWDSVGGEGSGQLNPKKDLVIDGELRPQPDSIYGTKATIDMIQKAMERGQRLELRPNGEIVTGGAIGPRPDGTYGVVVTIREGLIDPIRGQAESDKVTVEEWISTRLGEYLDSWWSPAESR